MNPKQPVSLHEPYQLGNVQLRNRSVLAPLTRVSAHADGTVSARMTEYYRIFAAGGFGAVITEGSYIDSAHSQTYLDQAGMARDEHVASWRPVTEAIHAEGAAAIAQLQHSGPQMQGNAHAKISKGPSAVAARGEQLSMYRGSGPYPRPEALTISEIADIRQSFVDSALRAREAGFDGVEIHGANGYLIDAFLTDYLNIREDSYGGSPRNRVRFAAEIASDIRSSVGDDFIVGIRISQGKASDGHHKWSAGAEEAHTIFSMLAASGLDYIHTTEHYALEPAFPEQDSRSLAELARTFAPELTIIANGHVDTGDEAQQLLTSDQAHLVAIGKAALANRDWPIRVRDDHPLNAPFNPRNFDDGLATVEDWEIHADDLLSLQRDNTGAQV